ncbi:Serpentine receptor class epsilon-26 [Caenorhabditis elegans]|uniref:Serpentine receptor class epsilon-26 n=1 Tax=Caenorhabditis elegans TaxID=6239 RepID=SRE26_CAEEL|nr:Serpentine receptor class epsilon-26 [Caenorhabditis elegans]O62489.1 RecName: Full=Serpentine receptor class epsilon-26; Short=Protein sre-26 [Caenorhabditis elegans]CAA19546.1 Serpentine receptor class epsilon-26 [Caenorhabditis elegans]|eukprot:NP_496637.1 Serpentine receptor class epsilon-26 [Caenorhabditis elegans]
MFIKLSSTNSTSIFWLPIFFYNEPYWAQCAISSAELPFYMLSAYVVFVSCRIMLKIQLFHDNLMYIGVPMFGSWFLLIAGKLITILYRVRILNVESVKIHENWVFWTDEPEKMLNVQSLDGLVPLLVAGFLEIHFGFSVIFVGLAIVTERVIASMLIDNYEQSTSLLIPISFIIIYQFLAISISLGILFNILGLYVLNASWILCILIGTIMYYYIRKINTKWLQEMQNPNRKRVFTVSQQFQVRENLGAIAIGKRLVFVVLATIVVMGFGIVALVLEITVLFFMHFGENTLFCYPLYIFLVVMNGHPAWKQEFRKYFPKIKIFKKVRPGLVSVEIVEDQKKKLSLETDTYFRQLKSAWT